jgi:toxin ParE1/3/4
MSLRIRQHQAAVQDIQELANYIRRDSPNTAARFIRAARSTFRKLADQPGLGSIYEADNPSVENLRYWSVDGFRNHLVFYRVSEDTLEIVRVLHGAQNIDRRLSQS